MEIAVSVLLGLGLAAAVGFRVFIPFLIMSLAARFDMMELSSGFAWISSMPALLLFATATVFEVFAYFIPWFDNLLDTIMTPLAMICGTVVMASTIVEIEPWIKWTLAIIAGGGTAGLIKGTTATTRATSSVLTAGIGNPLLSTIELITSGILSVLALVIPIVAGVCIVLIFIFIYRRRKKKQKKVDSQMA